MEIKIYGTGCAKCKALFENTQTALDAAGIDAHIEKVTDLEAIAKSGILMTPTLEIDGKIVSSGKRPRADEILAMLSERKTECSCCSCRQNHAAAKKNCCSGKSSAKKLLVYILITIAVLGIAVMLISTCGR